MKRRTRTSAWAKSFERSFVAMTRMATASGTRVLAKTLQPVIAKRTPGFTGADLANLVNEAALLAARVYRTTVEQGDLNEAIERVVAGIEKKSRVLQPDEK